MGGGRETLNGRVPGSRVWELLEVNQWARTLACWLEGVNEFDVMLHLRDIVCGGWGQADEVAFFAAVFPGWRVENRELY